MVEKIILNSGDRTACIQLKGAELTSYKVGDMEYIWQADPMVWAKHAPILFPIVGKLKNDRYEYWGKTYSMSQHGFARDRVFELVSRSEHSAVFLLRSDAESLLHYPFHFELSVIYTLLAEGLEVRYQVKNLSTEPIYFSIGGHPGFLCPLRPEAERLSEYYLDFGDKELTALSLYTLEHGNISLEKKHLSLSQGGLALHEELFLNDALILDTFPPARVSIRHRDTGRGFGMEYGDFRWLGIWTKESGAGFICLEPWNGIADTVDHEGDLTRKLGIQVLHGEAEYAAAFRMFFW